MPITELMQSSGSILVNESNNPVLTFAKVKKGIYVIEVNVSFFCETDTVGWAEKQRLSLFSINDDGKKQEVAFINNDLNIKDPNKRSLTMPIQLETSFNLAEDSTLKLEFIRQFRNRRSTFMLKDVTVELKQL